MSRPRPRRFLVNLRSPIQSKNTTQSEPATDEKRSRNGVRIIALVRSINRGRWASVAASAKGRDCHLIEIGGLYRMSAIFLASRTARAIVLWALVVHCVRLRGRILPVLVRNWERTATCRKSIETRPFGSDSGQRRRRMRRPRFFWRRTTATPSSTSPRAPAGSVLRRFLPVPTSRVMSSTLAHSSLATVGSASDWSYSIPHSSQNTRSKSRDFSRCSPSCIQKHQDQTQSWAGSSSSGA